MFFLFLISVENFELQDVYVNPMTRDTSSSSKLIPKVAEKEEVNSLTDHNDNEHDFYKPKSGVKDRQEVEDFKFEEVSFLLFL